MASHRAPSVFRRLGSNPSILTYRGRARGLVDSAYGSDRRSTLAADRGRFEVQPWKPQLGQGPVPPFGVPRDHLHSDRGPRAPGNRKGICRYPSLCVQLLVRHMIASEPEYCIGFDPKSIAERRGDCEDSPRGRVDMSPSSRRIVLMSTHVKCRRIDLDQIARTAKPLALRHWFTVTSKSPSAHVVAHVGPAMIAIGRSPLSQPRPVIGVITRRGSTFAKLTPSLKNNSTSSGEPLRRKTGATFSVTAQAELLAALFAASVVLRS